ncbi:MAG: translation elongation factor-like protein [Candidatus Omnitrophica bacterium]|nr:translation elongation factor-like protein [Candidatus Omnitrophota bacterium]
MSVGIIKLKKPLKVGDKIRIKGAHLDFSQTIKSMQVNHQNVAVAQKNAEIGIKVKKKVHPHDKVYKKTV